MGDPIDRQAAIDAIADYLSKTTYTSAISHLNTGALILARVPSAQPKKGKWEEREVLQTADVGEVELQSARCSVCGLYHTTPYMYYFSDYNYCPNCGAKMVNNDG